MRTSVRKLSLRIAMSLEDMNMHLCHICAIYARDLHRRRRARLDAMQQCLVPTKLLHTGKVIHEGL